MKMSEDILILIVLIDSTKKTLGYKSSCWVTFEIFRFFRGPNGGLPYKISNKNLLETVMITFK